MRTTLKIASFLLLLPELSLSCPVLTEPEQVAEAIQARRDVKAAVSGLYNAADSVFVGRVVELTAEKVAKDTEGELREIEKYWISFDVTQNIKGVSRAERFTYEKDPGLIHVGCSALVGFNEVDFPLTKGYRYLVYAKNGVILRNNLVVDWFDEISAEEEFKMLREHGAHVPE